MNAQIIEVTVQYTLSPTVQKTALLACLRAEKFQQITGPIPVDLLDMCEINADGSVTADYTEDVAFDREGRVVKSPFGGNHYHVAQDAPAQDAADLLMRMRAGIQARSAEVRAETEQELAEKAKRQEAQDRECEKFLGRLADELDADPDAIPKIDYPHSVFDRMRYWHESNHPLAVEIRRRQAVAKQRNEEQDQARAAAQKTALREWLAEHGTPDQVERFDVNLLPEDELKVAIADWAFQNLKDYPLFERLTEREVRYHASEDERYQECDAQFRSIEPTELTSEQWSTLKALCEAASLVFIPEGVDISIEPRLHQGTLDSTEVPWGVVERMAARATTTVCGVEVRREYAL